MLKKILFIGLGGAGQRHLRLFKKELDGKNVEFIAYRTTNKTPLLNPDFTVNKKGSIQSTYGIRIFEKLSEALELKPELAIISTPSSMHLQYAKLCIENGINVFIEKPLSDSLNGIQKLKELRNRNKVNIQVGYQRRFHPHISKVKDIVQAGDLGRILTVNFTVASYIPRWHPYENFLDLYACRKELGGGVLLTEIHEIDLAVWYFGEPISVVCVGGTYSNVGMDVEDTVRLTLDYLKFSVQINLTFWQKYQERFFSISGENGYLCWDQDDDTLTQKYFNRSDQNIVEQTIKLGVDAMFETQVKSIIKNLDYRSNEQVINDSLVALKIVEAAKKSMQTKRVIMLSEIKNG